MLEASNGCCQCACLTCLYDKRKSAEKSLAQCEFFKRNADLEDSTDQDMRFLLDYKKAVKVLHRLVRAYHVELTKCVRRGTVKMMLHSAATMKILRAISPKEADRVVEDGDVIVSLHCTECGQQLDLMDTKRQTSKS